MGVAKKLIEQLVEQAETLARHRQLADKRRDEICDLEHKLRETEKELQRLRQVHLETQHEDLTVAQATIADLRRQLGAAKAWADNLGVSAENLRQDRDQWRQARQQAIGAGELMKAEIETLRKQLADAQPDASDKIRQLQEQIHAKEIDNRDVIYRLDGAQAAINSLKSQLAIAQQETAGLQQQLDAAKAELTRERLDAEERGHELERLRAFVDLSRRCLGMSINHANVDRLLAALAELDARTTEPAPVAETPDAEGGA